MGTPSNSWRNGQQYDKELQMFKDPPGELNMNYLKTLRLAHLSGRYGGEWYNNSQAEILKDESANPVA